MIDLAGATLTPGLVEGHSHVLLHPYNETTWNDQVAHEALALRTARAVNHLRATLMAGFTTVRDLGTEGAGYADVGFKQAVDQGIIPGPRMLVVDARDRRDRQLRSEGSPRSGRFHRAPKKPTESTSIARIVRESDRERRRLDQVLCRLSMGAAAGSHPTFTPEELAARRRNRAYERRAGGRASSTPEGMRNAMLAGVDTIEHGDAGTPEVFKLMAEKKVALCPTLAAGDATASTLAGTRRNSLSRRRLRASARASRRRSTPA